MAWILAVASVACRGTGLPRVADGVVQRYIPGREFLLGNCGLGQLTSRGEAQASATFGCFAVLCAHCSAHSIAAMARISELRMFKWAARM